MGRKWYKLKRVLLVLVSCIIALIFTYTPFLSKVNLSNNSILVKHLSDSFINQRPVEKDSHNPKLEEFSRKCSKILDPGLSDSEMKNFLEINQHSFNLRYNENGSFPACADYFIQREGFLHRGTVTDLERSLPVAFSIIVYHNFDQVEQLLLALYRKHNFYCLHVDKKASSNFMKLVNQDIRVIYDFWWILKIVWVGFL